MRYSLIFILKIYSFFISPFLGNKCKFHPSCSAYAQAVLTDLPIHVAFSKIVYRLLRCSPLSDGGVDLRPRESTA